jgi:hypothetical protein
VPGQLTPGSYCAKSGLRGPGAASPRRTLLCVVRRSRQAACGSTVRYVLLYRAQQQPERNSAARGSGLSKVKAKYPHVID